MIAKFWLRTCLPLCAALIVLASPATAQQSPPVETIFQNVRVLDVVKGEVGPATDVVVRGNRIASITSSAKAASGAKIIDGKGHTLMPGLIDAHVHFGFGSLLLTQLYDPKTTPETLSAAMTNSAKQMLLRGFTAARDMGGPIFPLKRAIDAGKTPGPRI
jgi:imidazolonepropionase-like amidohydrolase